MKFSPLLPAAMLLLGVWTAATPASAGVPVQVPNCSYAGESLPTADLSTTPVAGAIDPHWSVRLGNARIPGAPGHTALDAWTALPLNWIQPSPPSQQANGNEPQGDYTYSLNFQIPCDPSNYSNFTLTGHVAADNEIISVSANGNSSVASCSGTCFNTPVGGTAFAIPVAMLRGGSNTLNIVVRNDGQWSGLSVVAFIVARCGKGCCIILYPPTHHGQQTAKVPVP